LHLFYGQEFFDYINHSDFWTALISWIKEWTDSLPNIPEINFDLSPNSSFEEIKTLEPKYWRKLLENETVWKDGIIRVLFVNGTTLKMLFSYFSQQESPVYHDLAKALLEKINKYYY
jgi:hypothetical protein